MSVPATSNYNPNRGRVVQLALTDVGAIGPGVINPAADAGALVTHANDILAQLIMSMDADGALLWRVQRRTLTTISGTAAYVLASDVYDIDEPGRYTLSGQTTGSIVTTMARDEYMYLGDRTLQGTPIRYFAEKALNTAGLETITLQLYPVPPASGDTFEYPAVVKARDQSTDANTLDVPQKWIRCLRFGLATDLAMAYGLAMDRINFLNQTFHEERDRLLNDDNERGDVQICAFGAYYYGSYSGRGNYR
jgi:hypothetical protein